MKKLLLIIIVFVTASSYCQTAEEYYKRGMSKDSLKDRRGAIEDYTKAIELNPNYSEAYRGRGWSKNELKDKKGARLDWAKAQELKK